MRRQRAYARSMLLRWIVASTRTYAASFVSLFSRQLLFVTGKGGVGKTTVTAALALAASAGRARRVIVCEVAGQARIPVLLGAEPGRPGEEVQLADRLWATTIDPRGA